MITTVKSITMYITSHSSHFLDAKLEFCLLESFRKGSQRKSHTEGFSALIVKPFIVPEGGEKKENKKEGRERGGGKKEGRKEKREK